MEEKIILNVKDIQHLLGNLGRDKTYSLLRNAKKTGKPFPILTSKPYRVASDPFMAALKSGEIKVQ